MVIRAYLEHRDVGYSYYNEIIPSHPNVAEDDLLKVLKEVALEMPQREKVRFLIQYGDRFSDAMMQDEDFIVDLGLNAANYGTHFSELPQPLRENVRVVKEYLMNSEEPYKHLSDKMKSNREIATTAVTMNGLDLEHVPEALKDDRNIVWAAVMQNNGALRFASQRLQSDYGLRLIASGETYTREQARTILESVYHAEFTEDPAKIPSGSYRAITLLLRDRFNPKAAFTDVSI